MSKRKDTTVTDLKLRDLALAQWREAQGWIQLLLETVPPDTELRIRLRKLCRSLSGRPLLTAVQLTELEEHPVSQSREGLRLPVLLARCDNWGSPS